MSAHGNGAVVATPTSLGSGVPRLGTHEYGASVLASSVEWTTEGVATLAA